MWETFKDGIQSIIDFFYSIFLSFIEFAKDFILFAVELLMKAAFSLISLVGDGLGALDPLQYISAIPDETKAFMAMAGFNESMGIIVGAIGIRILLQLIPFVRLGS